MSEGNPMRPRVEVKRPVLTETFDGLGRDEQEDLLNNPEFSALRENALLQIIFEKWGEAGSAEAEAAFREEYREQLSSTGLLVPRDGSEPRLSPQQVYGKMLTSNDVTSALNKALKAHARKQGVEVPE